MKTRGFTLIELLVVIVILGLLITLGSKGLRAARISAKKAKARVEMKSIETAVMAYFNKYGKLPSDEFSSDSGFGGEGSDNASLISVLTFTDDAEGLNPAEISFLESQTVDSTGYVDPWGVDYVIHLDTNYDGQLTDDDGNVHRKKVLIESWGLFLQTGKTNDYIYSWE